MSDPPVGCRGAICAFVTAVCAGFFYIAYRALRRKKEEVPKEPIIRWRAVGRLKSIHMYPLKGGHRFEVQDVHCTSIGSHKTIDGFDWRDSCFVVYDPNTMEYKTAKHHPALMLVNIKPLPPGKFGLSTPDIEEIEINLPDLNLKPRGKICLNDKDLVNFWDCGDSAADFFSMAILKKMSGLRLGYHGGVFLTKSAKGYHSDHITYHMVSKASVDTLNKKLAQPVTEHYFRPNFYVHGHHIKAKEEDTWEWVKIGSAIFKNPKGDPAETQERATLSENKKPEHSAADHHGMGVNLELHTQGNIHVHDQIYVTSDPI